VDSICYLNGDADIPKLPEGRQPSVVPFLLILVQPKIPRFLVICANLRDLFGAEFLRIDIYLDAIYVFSVFCQMQKKRKEKNRRISLRPRSEEASNNISITLMQGITKIGSHRSIKNHRYFTCEPGFGTLQVCMSLFVGTYMSDARY
jgi:hypothetical protein